MKNTAAPTQPRFALRRLLAALLAAPIALAPLPSWGASIRFAAEPLENATPSTEVLPNLLISFDDSGSMAWNKLPDWVGKNWAFLLDTIGRKTSDLGCTADATCSASGSRLRSAAWNASYYNPANRYDPPAYFNTDGTANTTTYKSMTGMATDQGANTDAKPNWKAVRRDRFGQVQGTTADNIHDSPIRRAAYYVEAGEYCSDVGLRICRQQSSPDSTYKYAAPLRFCSSQAIATSSANPANNACQGFVKGSFTRTRYPEPRESSFTVSTVSNGATVTSIKVAGQEILPGTVTATSTNTSNMANAIANRINECNGRKTGNCQVAGSAATVSGSTILITAGKGPDATPWSGTTTLSLTATRGTGTFTTSPSLSSLSNFSTNAIPGYNLLRIIDPLAGADYPLPGSTSKATDRTDCAGSLCTGNEEMTNFANWHAYYSNRSSAMKTSMSLALRDVQPKYRLGIMKQTQTSTPDVPVNKYEGGHKKTLFDSLFNMPANQGTPTRQAHATAGKYFAKKLSGTDPMQYWCQANYVFLATDGYWNGNAGTTLTGGSFSPAHLWKSAEYYYTTDLRTPALGNCTGAVEDVCPGTQKMGTFGMALGIPGEIVYQSDYKTASSGEYFNAKANNYANWPTAVQESPTSIDDLWRATDVSGGTYFSAGNPKAVTKALKDALMEIDAKSGAGAEGAVSNSKPVAGDNAIFMSSYRTVKWTGNLTSAAIDVNTGAVVSGGGWCVENEDSCTTGTLKNKVSPTSDTRRILIKPATGSTLAAFSLSNVNALGLGGNFTNSFLRSALSQKIDLTPTQLNALDGDKLVGYLRGRNGYEMRASNLAADQLFRARETTLGDIVHSAPTYSSKPFMKYSDPGYDAFKTAQAGLPGMVYVGANDGMLHAFSAIDGVEQWAYIPSMVIPELWRLADYEYPVNHRFYVDGSITVTDVNVGGAWKTILVGALRSGGRGIYALDITDPINPKFLWEFSSAQDADFGYSFGTPVITKKADNTWVVLMNSGYNNGSGSGYYLGGTEIPNSPAGNGQGYLYVLDAGTGARLHKFGTGVGTQGTPSGLGPVSAWADDQYKDNKAKYVYAGDLQGNVWRFDINASSGDVRRIATLTDESGNPQPITIRPELGLVNEKRWVYLGTGKYLEVSDLTTTGKQGIYGLEDPAMLPINTLPTRVHGSLLKQTLTKTAADKRTITDNPNDSNKKGCYVLFPDTGERQYVNFQLVSGTLISPSMIPIGGACSSGGYGWLNFIDMKNCGSTNDEYLASVYSSNPIVGIRIVYIKGKPKAIVTTAEKKTELRDDVRYEDRNAQFMRRKVMWRELIQ